MRKACPTRESKVSAQGPGAFAAGAGSPEERAPSTAGTARTARLDEARKARLEDPSDKSRSPLGTTEFMTDTSARVLVVGADVTAVKAIPSGRRRFGHPTGNRQFIGLVKQKELSYTALIDAAIARILV
jgi:hypothetical protein